MPIYPIVSIRQKLWIFKAGEKNHITLKCKPLLLGTQIKAYVLIEGIGMGY